MRVFLRQILQILVLVKRGIRTADFRLRRLMTDHQTVTL